MRTLRFFHLSREADVSPRVTVQIEDFNLEREVSRLRASDASVGAVVSFVGTVRDAKRA